MSCVGYGKIYIVQGSQKHTCRVDATLCLFIFIDLIHGGAILSVSILVQLSLYVVISFILAAILLACISYNA
jgi:hypothetical protein